MKRLYQLLFLTIIISCTNESIGSETIGEVQADNNIYRLSIQDTDTIKNIIYYLEENKEIPIDFIKTHTIIDSVYYYEGVFFESDTVYILNDKFNAWIVSYSDGFVCSNKFILIIDSKNYANTSYVLGSTNCDRDGESEYYYYSFVIERGKIIITENKVAKGQELENTTTVETIEYSIDESGKLFSHY